jgi:elongation factor G
MSDGTTHAPRCAALVGPYLSGKTTLFESILFATGATNRKGSVKDGNTVGDGSPEARARQMSAEVSVADMEYLGDRWTVLDCPGSIELAQDAYNALAVADIAVVVCEPDPGRAQTLAPLFRYLDANQIPHMVFINKMDHSNATVRENLEALQAVSARPLVLRQVPIREGDDVTGYVDLISERAYKYQPGQASDLISIPEELGEREQTARMEMLEALADFDDTLLEQLLEDVVPPKEEIYGYLAKDLRDGHIVPILLGSAEFDHGVRRLLKALRHDTPEPSQTAERQGIEASDEVVAQVFKTVHAAHTGKLSLARLWHGEISEGMTLNGDRASNIYRMFGQQANKVNKIEAGQVLALGRMDEIETGDLVTPVSGAGKAPSWTEPRPPVYAFAIHAENRADEVKLTGAVQRLIEEDPSYVLEQNPETHQMLLWGQGEVHLQIALERLKNKYKIEVQSEPPQTPYRESIRKSVSQHARFKRQTGGHGQFGDVEIDIAPLPRGEGFTFINKIVGGAIPRNYIPAVEHGVREYMKKGPLGFNVVDVVVTLNDGQFHAVDSSDMAFRTAGRMAMSEGMPKCSPVLLEPILEVTVSAPSEFTPGVQRLLSGRRGQILGFDARPGWPGWDQSQAHIPQSEMYNMIVELRSLSMGVGTFEWKFDHLQELTGRLADDVVQLRSEAAAQ